MASPGRPLRFLGATLGTWILVRVAMLWPDAQTFVPVGLLPSEIAAASPRQRTPSRTRLANASSSPAAREQPGVPQLTTTKTISPLSTATAEHRRHATFAMPGRIRFRAAQPVAQPDPVAIGRFTMPASDATFIPFRQERTSQQSRWSASLWFLARAGDGLGGPNGGQLGGDQAGMRLPYAIDRARRVAIVGRIATPLAGVGREGAVGIEWRPTRLPVRIVAEHRFAIDGGGGGPSVGIVGGAGPAPIGGGFSIEGYGQAGVIERRGIIGFGDGAVRVVHGVVRIGRARVDVGAGAWGGIQPGADRLDIGPTLGLTLPVGDRSLRLALDWRERIGGGARPNSGLALSIGTDF